MANDRMTVSDLVSRVKDIRETVEKLDKLNAVMQTDADIHDRTNHALKEKFGVEHEIVYLLNGTRSKLSEYADLLDRIMKETVLPWPPSVEMADKR